MGWLESSLVRLLVPRHAVVFVPDGGAADAYGASNGHDPLAAVSGRSTVDSTSASTIRSSTSGGANGESCSVHPARFSAAVRGRFR